MDKEKYIELTQNIDDISIYNKPFWLDAVCGSSNWDAVVIEENEDIVAAVPYFCKRRYGVNYLSQPQLTQNFQIWMKPVLLEKKEKLLEMQFSIIEKVVMRLLDIGADFYNLSFSSELTNWEPFYWNGFHQETRYSFIIDAKTTIDELQKNMSSNLRRDIKQAAKKARIIEISDIDVFYKYNSMSFIRQGINNPVSKECIKSLYDACNQHNACKMIGATDDTEIHCVGFYVFDNNYVYEILLGTDPDKRNSNFKSYMTYEMIKYAIDTGRGFDFEGSMIKPIANYNRRFGADLIPYHKIWKINTNNYIKRVAIEYKMGR